jgi:FMN reductase
MSAILKVVAISGSLQQPSRTSVLIQAIVAELGQSRQIEFKLIEISQIGRQLGAALTRAELPAAIQADLAAVESADLVIAASPVYRASYTGLFKHFVDFIGWDKLYNKPVLVAASGGSDRHALVLEHQLRPLFATMQANVLPLGVYASEADFSDYAVSSAALVDRIKLAVARSLPYLNATK